MDDGQFHELVLEPSGERVRVPNHYISASSLMSQAVDDRIENRSPEKSLIYHPSSKVTAGWLSQDDTLKQKDTTVRRAWREFWKAYQFCTIMPMISLSGNIRLVKGKSYDGLHAIAKWLDLFQADIRQPTIKRMGHPICESYRTYGETWAEMRFLRDPALKTIGFPTGMMLKRIHFFPAYWVPRNNDNVIYDGDGNLTYLSVTNREGIEQVIEGSDINRFLHMKNRPESENRGLSFLLPLMRQFASEQDTRNIAVDGFDGHIHPFEHHQVFRNSPDGMMGRNRGQKSWKQHRNDHVALVNKNRWNHNKALVTDEFVKINVIGFNQKMVDPTGFLTFLDHYNMKSAMIPNLFEGKDTNRATMQEIKKWAHTVHAESIDHFAFKNFYERMVFPIVLWTMGHDTRDVPEVKFPALRLADRFADLQADKLAVEIYGEAHMRQLAAEKGITLENELYLNEQTVGRDGEPTLREVVLT